MFTTFPKPYRVEIFFSTFIGAGLGLALIVLSSVSLAWMVLISLSIFVAAFGSVLLYAKKDLTFCLLCLYVFCLPVEINKAVVLHTFADGSFLVKYPSIPDLVGFFMIVSWFFDIFVFKKRQQKIYSSQLFAPYALFAFWSVLSVINAVVPLYPLSFISAFIKWFLTFVVMVNTLNSKERIKTVLWVMVLSVLFQSFYVFLQTVFHLELRRVERLFTLLGLPLIRRRFAYETMRGLNIFASRKWKNVYELRLQKGRFASWLISESKDLKKLDEVKLTLDPPRAPTNFGA